jgi:hypothetical protein
MDQLASVEDMPEEASQQLLEMQSASQASHDMFKGYVEKDSSVDGDATEQEPDDDELSEMETKETDEEEEVMEEKAYSVQEDGEQFWVVDDEGNLMAGPYASQEEADMNRYELESQAINYASHRVNGKSMPSLQQSIWDRMKAGEQVSVTDEDLDIIESYFQNNDDPDDSLVGYMASIPNPDGGGYLAFLKRSYSKDTFMEEDPMMIGDGDKDISEQVMLYDANTNKPLRPATPEEIEACQNSPSGMIDVGGALCCVKSFGMDADADDIALKLIGLIADGKGKEMTTSVRKMLGDRLKGSYASGSGETYSYSIEQRDDGYYVVWQTGDVEGPYVSQEQAEESVNRTNDLYQGN